MRFELVAVEAHLALNHLPFAALFFGTALLLYGMFPGRQEHIKLGFIFYVFAFVITIPVFIAGEAGHNLVANIDGVRHSHIELHEKAAKLATVVMFALGVLLAIGHFRFRGKEIPGWYIKGVLAMALGGLFLLVNTQKLGGAIRHPETRPDFVMPSSTTHDKGDGGHDHDSMQAETVPAGTTGQPCNPAVNGIDHSAHDSMNHEQMGHDDGHQH